MGVGSDNLDGNFADSSQVTAERGENEALANKLARIAWAVLHRGQPFAGRVADLVEIGVARSPVGSG